ncbi:MAG: hypothetical protein KDJ52_02865 [Anaerolineae bacterium]|nr:hypothetical protein [Anaerolineae bacterium]
MNTTTPLFSGRVGFAVGTGRNGTHFLAEVLGNEPGVAASHERNPLNETFHRYCQWYKLPVDHAGYLQTKEQEIRQDLAQHRFSFEASAHLSLSICQLYERFGAKFLLLTRSPERVINSYVVKGWYTEPFVQQNPRLALGYQQQELFHRFLGRIAPQGEKFEQWNKMTRIGKLAWYWSALHKAILEQFAHIPTSHWRVEKLETFKYEQYISATQFLGIEASLSASKYNAIVKRRPASFNEVPTIADWNQKEIAEFEAEVGHMASKLGYEYQVDQLPIPPHKPISLLSRLKVALKNRRQL